MPRIDPNNSARFWRDRHLGGLSLMHADFTTHEYPQHTHDALVIAVTEQGGSVVKSRGALQDATPSTLFVFNPGEPHGGSMGRSARWRYRSLYLTRSALARLAEEVGIGEAPYFTRNSHTDRELIGTFLATHLALEEGRDAFAERELLVGAFGTLFRRHGSSQSRIGLPPRDRVLLSKAIERMRAEFAGNLRLESLAAGLGLTTFQLIGLFKRTVGLTPHAYLTQLRLGEACRHLRRSSALAEVAAAVGFYDQSALSKHFKRCYGITPLQFARGSAA